MDKYLNPITQQVMNVNEKYIEWYKNNPQLWRTEIDKLMMNASSGKIRAFQLFFNSPIEALSGMFYPQVLEEKDMEQMHPKLLTIAKSLDNNSYLYIFVCNGGGVDPNQALCANTTLSFN